MNVQADMEAIQPLTERFTRRSPRISKRGVSTVSRMLCHWLKKTGADSANHCTGVGVVSHGNTLSGLTDNILNTAASNRYHFSNCQADTTAFSTGSLNEQEQSIKGIVDLFLKGIESEIITTANGVTTEPAANAVASDKSTDDLLSMMATNMPMSSTVGAVGA